MIFADTQTITASVIMIQLISFRARNTNPLQSLQTHSQYPEKPLNKNAFLVLVIATIGSAFTIGATSIMPVAANARAAAVLYAKNCASCHGRDGGAKTLKARLNHARKLSDAEWQNRVSDERIFNSILNGKSKMPAYAKKLSEQEIDSLVTYVRGLKK
jgi:mono/diheme cytochrome c family protein